jgi:2-C-methyl-D-erythritol 4-phosphate cytidylyltransferase
MHVTAIVLAAGKGVRFGARVSKPLVEISFRPLVAYSLLCLDKHPMIREIIVAVNAANRGKIIKVIARYRLHKVKSVVLGGKRRQDSVMRALTALPGESELVLIQDCARPFITAGLVSATIREAKKCGAAVAGVPVKATIKAVDAKRVEKTLERKKLWEIQTPQVFKRKVIVEAYKRFGRSDVTDDASVVEKTGRRVSAVMGSYSNIKITTPGDVAVAEALLKHKR